MQARHTLPYDPYSLTLSDAAVRVQATFISLDCRQRHRPFRLQSTGSRKFFFACGAQVWNQEDRLRRAVGRAKFGALSCGSLFQWLCGSAGAYFGSIHCCVKIDDRRGHCSSSVTLEAVL